MKINKSYQILQQYGYTPTKLLARLENNEAPKVIANSIPKAGTNLLLRALYLLHPMHRALIKTVSSQDLIDIKEKINKLKKGQFLAGHIKYSKEIELLINQNKLKNILMVRDPRDIAVSNFIYITYKDHSHRLNKYFKQLNSDDERLMASIKGINGALLSDNTPSLSISDHLKGYMPWLHSEHCHIVRFEDLVGSKGGGDNAIQLATLRKLINYLEIDIDNNKIRLIAKKIYNPESRTFEKGQIGTWKEKMNESHKQIVKDEANEILVSLGYESDMNW